MTPTDALREARRAIEGISEVSLVGEYEWDPRAQSWVLAVELHVESGNTATVPSRTAWHFVISPRFPWGDIDVYPSKHGGIVGTFPHQDRNTIGDPDRPWRAGDICVRDAFFAVGDTKDPKGDASRLAWYVGRTAAWLRRAALGTLLAPGDPFELPKFSDSRDAIGFSEDESTYRAWQDIPSCVAGTAEIVHIGHPFPMVVRQFSTLDGRCIMRPKWGAMVSDSTTAMKAGWIRLPNLPISPPYSAPSTWGEFMAVAKHLGLRLALLEQVFNRLRDNAAHIFLIGFPIPRRIGAPASVMHWQPLALPALSCPQRSRGFRSRDASLWKRDTHAVLRSHNPISWLAGCNWHHSELSGRGQLSKQLRECNILVIGAGSVGSILTDSLIRGGAHNLTVVDGDSLEVGNLARHVLAIGSVGRLKAPALSQHLNSLSLHANVRGVGRPFPDCMQDTAIANTAFDLVIDCTGSDDVAAGLSEHVFPSGTHFFSLSTGRGARRLYTFAFTGQSFPAQDFLNAVEPWIIRDRVDVPDADLPWDGIGCWHPVFPAQGDRVARLALRSIEELEQLVSGNPWSGLRVLDLTPKPDTPGYDGE